MRGAPDIGSIKTVNEVKQHNAGFRGRLSIPGWGTKYTSVYPDKEDAVAALVDLNAEVYGKADLAPPIDQA